MSLNLISSLSFLKSKLEKSEESKVKTMTRVDMFGGVTESDLDTDSDSDSSSSSRCSSPGFRTPEIKEGPTQDILRRCLEMLNNDLTEAEKVHKANLAKKETETEVDKMEEPVQEKFGRKRKRSAEAPRMTQKVEEPPVQESPPRMVAPPPLLVSPPRGPPSPPQGLLMISSPIRGSGARSGCGASMEDELQPLKISLDSPVRSPSPGPPTLEPQTTVTPSPKFSRTPSFTLPTMPAKGSSSNSTVTSSSALLTCSSVANTMSNMSSIASMPTLASMGMTTALPTMATMPTMASMGMTTTLPSMAPMPSMTTMASTASMVSGPHTSTGLQQILLPPVQAGQPQQIVLQPHQAQNLLQSLQTPKPMIQPQAPQTILQQPKSIVQQPQTILQQPQTIMQQPQALLQQPQTILQQHQTLLQQPQTLLQQPQGQKPMMMQGQVQVVQGSTPFQLTSAPIPLLSSTGALLGTIGGVSNTQQLLSSLQQFTLLLQSNAPNNQTQLGAGAVNNNQIQPVNNNQVQPNLTTQFNNQIQIQQGLGMMRPGIGMAGNQMQIQPAMLNNSQQIQTSLGQIQVQQNVAMVNNNQIHLQPSITSSQVQPSLNQIQLQPSLSLAGNQMQPGLVMAGSQLQVKQEPVSPVKTIQSALASQPVVPASQASQPCLAASPPTVQLVQDPATGLYNLVTSTGQPVPSSPAPPLQALCQSPKPCSTPLSSSPLKMPKLLLPSLCSAKENTPQLMDPNDGKFMCGVCGKYFGNQKNLRVHISEIHEGKRGEFSCDLCNKVFPRKRNMERHKNAVHLKNSPVCYMCHKAVVNLDMHIRRFHRGSVDVKIKVEETAPAT